MTDITELAPAMKAAAEKLGGAQWQTRKGFSGIEVIVKGSLERLHGFTSFQPVAADLADTKTARAIALFSPANVLALVEALDKAQLKYGHSDGWSYANWEIECQTAFHEHVAKGDPRDVAAYCAFMWYHGWKTEVAQTVPVVVGEAQSREAFEKWCQVNIERNKWHPEFYAHLPAREQWAAWEACRAAMLQAGNCRVIPEGSEQRIAEAVELLKNAAPAMLTDDSGPNGPLVGRLKAQVVPGCWCRTCRPVVWNDMRFVVCPDCGNKRCPRANDHRNACSGSNEPGQEGSAYSAAPQEPKP